MFMLLFLQHVLKAQVYPHLCLPQNSNRCTNNWKIPSTPPGNWKKKINFHLFPVIFVFLPLNQVLQTLSCGQQKELLAQTLLLAAAPPSPVSDLISTVPWATEQTWPTADLPKKRQNKSKNQRNG